MKLKTEFEADDYREMVQEYFEQRGFKVNDLEELCADIKKAYPDGLVVSVSPLDKSVIKNTLDAPPKDDNTLTRLSHKDLIDPEKHIRDDAEEADVIQGLLSKSRELKKQKDTDDDG